MLTVKRWKLDAIARLLVRVFICIFAGSLAVVTIHYCGAARKPNPWFFVLATGSCILLAAALLAIRKSWEPGRFLEWMLSVAVPFYLGFVLGIWAQVIAGPPGDMTALQVCISGLTFQGATLLLVGRFLREHLVGWKDAFGFGHDFRHAILIGVLAACLFLPVGLGLQILSGRVMEHFKVEPQEQEAVQALRNSTTWTYPLSLGLVAVVLAPAAEELLFRGILYPAIKFAGYPRIAWLVTSLLFAAVHLSLSTFAPLFLLALLLTYLYEKTDNLAASIAAHAVFNSLNLVSFFVQKRASG